MDNLNPQLAAAFDQTVAGTDIDTDLRAILIANKQKLVSRFVSSKASLHAISKSGLMGWQIDEGHADIIKHAFPCPDAARTLLEKLERIEQLLTAEPDQEFDFSTSKEGKDEAVTSMFTTLGFVSFYPITPSMLPVFSHKLMSSQYVPFPSWGDIPDATKSSTDLCEHFRQQLAGFGEPVAEVGEPLGNVRFSLYDVRGKDGLGFSLATKRRQLFFSGGADAVIATFGQLVMWARQLRVIINWKTPKELAKLAYIHTTRQGELQLVGGLAYSVHPVIVVITDGINFVILQPYNLSIRYLHTLPMTQDTLSVLPAGVTDSNTAFRFIMHHLQKGSPADSNFTRQDNDVNTELEKELRPSKRVKTALGFKCNAA